MAKYYVKEGTHQSSTGITTKAGNFTTDLPEDPSALFPNRIVSEAAGIIIEEAKVAADLAKMHLENTTVSPVVNAGDDFAVALPATGQMVGTVTDDDGDPFTYEWTKISGPNTVDFNDSAIEDPIATFGASGTYVLKLRAGDGSSFIEDTVTVTVTGP